MVLWHESLVLRTLLRLKELVWHLDHWIGFRDCFKNRARHLLRTKPSLTVVTLLPRLSATARNRTAHGSCQLCLTVASRGTLVALYAARRQASTAPIDSPWLHARRTIAASIVLCIGTLR